MSATSASIIARLGVDSGEFRKDLKAATAEAAQAGNQIAASHNKRAAAAERVWEKEKRVENQMVSLSGKLANAASANDALSATFTHLAESINLPLAGAIAAGAGIAIGDRLNKAAMEAEKLRDNLNGAVDAASAMDAADGITRLHTGLQGIATTLADLKKDQGLFAFISEGLGDMGATSADQTGAGQREKAIAAAMEQRTRLFKELVAAEQQISAIQEMILAGDREGAALAKVRLEYEQKLADARASAVKLEASPAELGLIEGEIAAQRTNAEKQVQQDFAAARAKELQDHLDAIEAEFNERQAEDEKYQKESEARQKAVAESVDESVRQLNKERYDEELKLAQDVDKRAREDAKKANDIAFQQGPSARTQQLIADDKAAHEDDLASLRDQFIDEQMAGPDARREARRESAKRGRLARRFGRELNLKRRGGKSAADFKAEPGTPAEVAGTGKQEISDGLDASNMAKNFQAFLDEYGYAPAKGGK